MDRQSFSQQLKDDLARDLPERDCCQRTLLAAILMAGGELVGLEPLLACHLRTASAVCVRLVLRLSRRFDGPPATWDAERTRQLRAGTRYTVRLGPPMSRRFLSRLGLPLEEGGRWSPSEYSSARRRCCKRAFAQGAFLVGGSVEDPRRAYHLEWTVRNDDFGALLTRILNELEMPVRSLRRRYHAALYVKAAEKVSRALSLMGATQGLLVLEEIRAVKETKNLVHRRVNCETANLARLTGVAVEQVSHLRRLEQELGLRRLPADLRPLARVRLRLPEASYKELGRALDPPLTKASIGRKLQRLLDVTRVLLATEGASAQGDDGPESAS